MFAVMISIAVVVAIFFCAARFLMSLPKIFLYVLVAAGLLLRFGAKKLLGAVPWTISALIAVTVGFIGLGRQFFGAGDAKRFVERFLPPRDFERETFSLAVIELMLVVREKFFC